MPRYRKRFLDCSQMSIEEAIAFGEELAEMQRDIMFWLGDLARYCEARWPDKHQQVWPEWASPGMLSRAAGTCRAYPEESMRETEATYTQYMQNAGRPDRLERLAAIVDKGLTSDESRQAAKEERDDSNRPRWLAAFDVSYFVHRFWHSGATVSAADEVASWIDRTVKRLADDGLTDVLCCFDSPRNLRKELTSGWEDKYKDRPPKDSELSHQLNLVRDLIERRGFACVAADGYEADDVMASIAKQFPGRVTIVTQDKDCRQCLSATCNMLLDVEWKEDETSGETIPHYKWLTAKAHTESTGISPDKWPDYQAIMGDATDGIKGAAGIGTIGAADLIKEYGSADAAIAAAKAGDERIKAKRRQSLIEFEPKLEVTRKLVTLRTDLPIPSTTRITGAAE